MVEMAFDSVAEVAEPGQAARQKIKRLLTISKAINLISWCKFRLEDPFLNFALVCLKFVLLKALLKIATFSSFLAICGSLFVYNAAPKLRGRNYKLEHDSFL